jgi:hypothetical protein
METALYDPRCKEELLIGAAIRLQQQLNQASNAPDVDVRYIVGYIDAICYATAVTDPWSQDPADLRLFRSNLHAGTIRARKSAMLEYVRTVAAELDKQGKQVEIVQSID